MEKIREARATFTFDCGKTLMPDASHTVLIVGIVPLPCLRYHRPSSSTQNCGSAQERTGRDRPRIIMTWIVYILECTDGSLYTGITNHLERRMKAHTTGKGAKYTKRRGPFTIRYTEYHANKGAALRREAAIKSLDRPSKISLISTGP